MIAHVSFDIAITLNRVLHALDGSIPIGADSLRAELSYLHAVSCQITGNRSPLDVSRILAVYTPPKEPSS